MHKLRLVYDIVVEWRDKQTKTNKQKNFRRGVGKALNVGTKVPNCLRQNRWRDKSLALAWRDVFFAIQPWHACSSIQLEQIPVL